MIDDGLPAGIEHFNYLEIIPNLKEKLNQFTKKQISEKLIDENLHRNELRGYNNLSQDYIQEYSTKTDYIQYARAYFSRLSEIKEELLKQCSMKWKNFKMCDNILDMKGTEVQIISGILYKEMPLKPSILKGIESILGSKKVESFVTDSEDFLILEDSSGRVRISNTSPMKGFTPGDFVTGLVAGVKGFLDSRGVFMIEDILFYKLNNYSLPMRIKIQNENNSSAYNMLSSDNNLICFISGLQFGKTDYSGRSILARNMLIDLIQTRLTTEGNVNKLLKRISRIVIVGNSIFTPDEADTVEKGSYLKQDLNAKIYRNLLENYDELDNFFNTLSHCVNLDVMPGVDDISSSLFPQLPINPLMLPLSASNSSINLVTNPYKFEIEDLLFLGTSGQNVDNIRKYSSFSKNPCDILDKTLEWCHISPSAPDTLRTYPYSGNDPLLLREIPNLYFVGNQKSFSSRLTHYNQIPVRLISVPDFSETLSFVLCDVNTLEVCEYSLDLIKN